MTARAWSGLQALPDGGGYTVRRTEINLEGFRATIGRSDTIPGGSLQDPVVAAAMTITCGAQSIARTVSNSPDETAAIDSTGVTLRRRLTDAIALAGMRPPLSAPTGTTVRLRGKRVLITGRPRGSARPGPNCSRATAPRSSSSRAAKTCCRRSPTGSPPTAAPQRRSPATCPTSTPSTTLSTPSATSTSWSTTPAGRSAGRWPSRWTAGTTWSAPWCSTTTRRCG